MLQDTAELAAKYLREAVPLMVKHQIPPTPFNYALWYSYVSKRDPILNKAMEKVLDSHGTCSSVITEELFAKHIIDDHIGVAENLQESLKGIMIELQGQVKSTLEGTLSFNHLLEESNKSLNQNETAKENLSIIISGLMEGTDKISQTAEVFRLQMLEAQKEVEQLKIELQRSQREAKNDPLTGLYNRRYLDEYMQMQIDSSSDQKMYVVLADIDHFKSFNDSYGHQVGDRVIQRVASLLKKSLIADEIGSRYGGEEFLLVLKETQVENVLARIEKMRKAVETIVLKDRREGKSVRRITASFGVAKFAGQESKEMWIERADQALYRAKAEGRNRVVSAD